jgi:hypothetical protein
MYCDDCLEKGRDELGHALDELGFGCWELESTGGGCCAWVLRMHDGRYVMVTGEDVLDGFGDASDFGEWVTLGLYESDGEPVDDGSDEPWASHLQVKAISAFTFDGIAQAVGQMMDALGIARVGFRVAYTFTVRFVAETPIMSDVLDMLRRDVCAQIEDSPTAIGVVGSVSVDISGRRLAGGE